MRQLRGRGYWKKRRSLNVEEPSTDTADRMVVTLVCPFNP
jgi:hypothetical protein